jgi:hypothetical protein
MRTFVGVSAMVVVVYVAALFWLCGVYDARMFNE